MEGFIPGLCVGIPIGAVAIHFIYIMYLKFMIIPLIVEKINKFNLTAIPRINDIISIFSKPISEIETKKEQ